MLIECQSQKKILILSIFKIQWVGVFFSSALPGLVTGDFVKLGYIKKIDPHLKNGFLVFSILFDRILGLIGLIFLSSASSAIFYDEIIKLNIVLKDVLLVNFLLFFSCTVLLSFLFIPNYLIFELFSLVKVSSQNPTLTSFLKFKDKRIIILKTIAISIFSHFISVLCFHLINYSFYQSIPSLKDLLAILPIGQIAIALPISPSGLGVGHLAYEKLFTFLHQTNGATLFNNYWLFLIITNLLGIIPFLIGFKNSKEN